MNFNNTTLAFLLAFGLLSCDPAEQEKTTSTNDTSPVAQDTVAVSTSENVDEFINLLTPEVQEFAVIPNEEALITCKEGTSIYLPANAFVFEDGSPVLNMITLEVKECYSLSAILAEDLQTRSGEQLLETGGMLNITASSDGKPLKIAKDRSYIVAMPKDGQDQKMNLFYGNHTTNGLDWIIDEDVPANKANQLNQDKLEEIIMNTSFTDIKIEDFYNYKFTVGVYSSHFKDWKLKGSEETVYEYFENDEHFKSEDAKLFADNNWRVHYKFKINDEGKMIDFKESPDEYTNENDQAYEILLGYLQNFPAIDVPSDYKWKNTYFSLGVFGLKTMDKDAYKKAIYTKYKENKTKVFEKMGVDELDHFVFAVADLGWINCDRFWNLDAEKTDYFVKVDQPENTKVIAVFKDIKSVMNGHVENDLIVFDNLPLGQEIKVISISLQNGQPMLCIQPAKVDKSTLELSQYKSFTLSELEKEINGVF